MRTIGFLVNPIAGMGGSVGLKGTDGDLSRMASKLGADQVSFKTARTFLNSLQSKTNLFLIAAPGSMGEDLLVNSEFDYSVVGEIGAPTTAEDTTRIARQMVDEGVEILVFVGGDGTARDVYNAIDTKLPVVAVPAGVKVYSSVFAYSAEAAANLLACFINDCSVSLREVLDINEEAYRRGELVSSLYGYLPVPDLPEFVQPGKATYGAQPSNQDAITDISLWVVEKMEPKTVYLLGPGSSIKGITDILNLDKTLLGVDACYENEIIQSDINEKTILSIRDTYPRVKIILTPIGGNGFIFGRGNKQFTPEVIRRLGLDNLLVIATPEKLRELNCLRVDTGDADLDRSLIGYINVITGYQESRMMKVCH